MTPQELIRKAIPLVRKSWYQSSDVKGMLNRAQGRWCPILAVDAISNKLRWDWRTDGSLENFVNEAIELMNKTAGMPIHEFNDMQETVEPVIAVMEKAAV